MTDAIGLRGVLSLLPGVMALTGGVSLLIPETKGRTLADIGEDLPYAETPASSNDISPATTVEKIEGHADKKTAV